MSRAGLSRGRDAAYADPRYEAFARELVAALQAGDDFAAERAAGMLVRANPRDHGAWHALAGIALRTGRAAAAVDAAERAQQLDRKNVEYLNTLGVAYGDLGRVDEAVAAFRRALKLQPAFVSAHYNLGKVLERTERLPEARDAYRRVLAIEPGYPAAKHNLARTLRHLGESAAALALAREVHAEQPEDVDRMLSLAAALHDASGADASIAFVEQCLARLPEEARLHSHLASLLLPRGEWEVGWREYLWRPNSEPPSAASFAPLPADFRGQAVRLVPDQGLGDVLFFLRFADAIRARSGKVILEPPPKLAPLLVAHPQLDHVATADARPPTGLEVAETVVLGDLPHRLRTHDVPPPLALPLREDLVAGWRARLAAIGPPPYVGLTWRGGTDLRAASEFKARPLLLYKEITLEMLAGIVRGFAGTLVSVQRLPAPGETERLAALAGRPVHDLSATNDDLERMLALLAVLDEYVGVSNTNMHLRAGIGLTARVLVPHPPEFRWMAAGDRSPWFPGFGVYRQRVDRDWTEALARLAADLRMR